MNVDQVSKANGQATPPKKKMSLDTLREGRIAAPFRVLLYGPEKAGKSTFAAAAPSPIFMGKDSGTEHLDIKRMPQPETWRDVLEGLHEVATRGKSLGFKTLVVDPLGWFEPMAVLDFTNDVNANLATWGGGHGAGYQALSDRWRMFIAGIERVWTAGLNVILIGHSTVKMFNDPEGHGYERYELAVDKRAAGPLKQWVDHILFTKREAYGKVDPTTKKAKAYGSAARMLYTEWTPAYDAGNRASLPAELPLSWEAFADALASGAKRAEEFRAQIDAGLAELGDPAVEQKVRAWMADAKADLAAIANAVAAKLGDKRAQQNVDSATNQEG